MAIPAAKSSGERTIMPMLAKQISVNLLTRSKVFLIKRINIPTIPLKNTKNVLSSGARDFWGAVSGLIDWVLKG